MEYIYIWQDKFYNNKFVWGGGGETLILKMAIGFFGAREVNGAWITLGVVYERHNYIYILMNIGVILTAPGPYFDTTIINGRDGTPGRYFTTMYSKDMICGAISRVYKYGKISFTTINLYGGGESPHSKKGDRIFLGLEKLMGLGLLWG